MRVQIGSVVVETGAAAPEGGPPWTLPRRPAAFTGRAEELEEIVAQASSAGAPSIICLCGRPGVGKTALALEAAHRLRGRFPGGALFAEARAHSGGERLGAMEVLERLLSDLGHSPAHIPGDREARAAAFREVTAGRRMVVVVDDVVSPAELPLLRPARGSLLLATGRRVMTAPDALTFALDGLRPRDAVRLLTAAGAGEETAEDIARACGRLPLALRIAAARLALDPGLRAADLAAALARPDGRLFALSDGMGDRAVRATFASSYASLDPSARRFFRLLAALPLADLTAGSAAVLTGAPDAGERLRGLADLHLLDVRDGHGGPRYRMHDLVALYARELLGPGRGDAAADRTAVWYAARTAEHRAALDGPDTREARQWYLEEWDNIVAAGSRLFRSGLVEELWALVRAVTSDVDVHSPFGDWERLHRWGARLCAQAGQPDRAARLHERLALAYREGMRMKEAFEEVAAMRELTAGDPRGTADADHAEANLLRDEGDLDRALWLTLRAHGVFVADRDWTAVGWALHGQADLVRAQGHALHSLRLRVTEIAAFTRGDDRFGLAWAYHGLGEAYVDLGRYAEAEANLRTALRVLAELGAFKSEGWTLELLAKVLLSRGREDDALVLFERALRSYETRGNRGDQARALLLLGDAAARRGRDAEAATLWRTARARLASLDGGRVEDVSERLRSRLEALTEPDGHGDTGP
ncbi:NB-ARC domain-containing protein [Actinocorallia herbida]|uniref:NB-ARC domain-containing protein n=1 Tax=Actinocorallia herbida TaxID=58109 RepID=A0A3N1DAI0_9ACTN|nr:tetratricopeptide repeat protein [Actinocorallia herbida]ROO90542.1 NB-ARC domain-containing protein [Actinocorallia herbida]